MTDAVAAQPPTTAPSPARPAPRAWLRSPAFDLAFFLAPVGLGLAYYLFVNLVPQLWFPVSAAFMIVLAYGHYSLTFGFFLDPEHSRFYRTHWIRYGLAPALFASVALTGFVLLPAIFLTLDYILTQHHVTKQSSGLCGLYRHRAGAFSPRAQRWENGTLFAACTVLVAHGLVRIDLLSTGWAQTAWYRTGSAIVLGATAALVAGVLLSMVLGARTQGGFGRQSPRIWFWLTSVAMYTPVLYVPTGDGPGPHLETLRTVIIIGLTQHWLQYYGIIYMHGRNKYTRPEHADQPAARWMSHLPRLIVAAVAFGMLLGGFRFLGSRFTVDTVAGRAAFGVVLAMGWVHYWLDRQIWAFKTPHNRQTILPYL